MSAHLAAHRDVVRRAGCTLLVAVVLVWIAGVRLSAHAGSIAFWHVLVETDHVSSLVLISTEDVGALAPDLPTVPGDIALAQLGPFADAIVKHFEVLQGQSAVPATVTNAQVLASGLLELRVRHSLTPAGGALALRSTFHVLTDDTHRVIARVQGLRVADSLVFHAAAPERPLPEPQPSSWRRAVGGEGSLYGMVRLGIEHVLTGYDHLVFLLGLLVAGGTWRSRVGIVSAFTVAHSITLVLAALDVVSLPPHFVEPAIAVSIAYVAVENLLGDVHTRWPTAFGFGLIHGFGFAGMLEALALPAGRWAAAVGAFSVGVEIGQLAVVALVLPVVAAIARSAWHRRVVQCTSVLVFGLAVVWFVERLP